jgi:hypothetical protein
MIVAWHEVPGMSKKREPVPEGQCDCLPLVYQHMSTRVQTQSSCPYGTGRFCSRIPGTSCQATII